MNLRQLAVFPFVLIASPVLAQQAAPQTAPDANSADDPAKDRTTGKGEILVVGRKQFLTNAECFQKERL